MRGVVVEYKPDRGFGFIKNINEEEYFFHIKSMIHGNRFLRDICDYFYVGDDRKCYLVDFVPHRTDKGLSAGSISLTREVFNDLSNGFEFFATVVDISYNVSSLTRVVSGIKKGCTVPFGVTCGGNGTYRLGYPEFDRDLVLRFRRNDVVGWGNIEVRDFALELNDRSKITNRFVDDLRNNLIGKEIVVRPNSVEWKTKVSTYAGIGSVTNKIPNEFKWELKDNSILEIY
jgi:hypothetical protein